MVLTSGNRKTSASELNEQFICPGSVRRVNSTQGKAVLVGGDMAVGTVWCRASLLADTHSNRRTDGRFGFLVPQDWLPPEFRLLLPPWTHQSASWMLTLFVSWLCDDCPHYNWWWFNTKEVIPYWSIAGHICRCGDETVTMVSQTIPQFHTSRSGAALWKGRRGESCQELPYKWPVLWVCTGGAGGRYPTKELC